MVSFNVCLLILVLSIENRVPGVLGETNKLLDYQKIAEIEELTKEQQRITQEIDKLNNQKLNIEKETDILKQSCNEEVQKLSNDQLALQANLDENQKEMVMLLKLIEEQEAEHAKLEAKLKDILEVLQIYESQYEIVYYDLKLMEFRRKNGTSNRCNEVATSLKKEFNEELVTRSSSGGRLKYRKPKLSEQEMKLRMLKREVGTKDIQRKQLSASVESLNVKYKILSDECKTKKSNLYNLILETNNTLVSSGKNIDSMRNDLNDAKAFTETLNLEIKTAKDFITELHEKMLEMKSDIANYKEDNVCYKYLEDIE